MTDKEVPLTYNFGGEVGRAVVKPDGTVICTVTDPTMVAHLSRGFRGQMAPSYSIVPVAADRIQPKSIKRAPRKCPDAESW